MDHSYLEAAFERRDNFKNLKYFGNRVWYRPPGNLSTKFKSNLQKGLSLGFLPETTKDILYYDQRSNSIKKVRHFCFDEDDLPVDQQPPNSIALYNSNNGTVSPIDPPMYCTTEGFDSFTSPFAETQIYNINTDCDDLTLGLVIDLDETSHQAFISQISTNKRCSFVKHFKTIKSAWKRLTSFYIVVINDHPCFGKGITD